MFGGGVYSQVQYDNLVVANQDMINRVMADPVLSKSVYDQWGVVAPTVTVLEEVE